MRSGFLQVLMSKKKKKKKSVAIPSKWGLVSYDLLESQRTPEKVESQSLLNEVWFPTDINKSDKGGGDKRCRNPF